MNKRLVAFIITLIMVVSFIPQTAFAENPTGLYVAGIKVTNDGPVTGPNIKGSVTYASGSNTLTLENATITATNVGEGDEYSGIYYSGDRELTIHLIGDNYVKKEQGGDFRNALYTLGPLEITAATGASLNLKAQGGNEGGGNFGISAHNSLTITGGNITAIGGDSGGSSQCSNYGIFVENGELEISGGSVTAVANGTDFFTGSNSIGIFCDEGNDDKNEINGAGNITIKNAIVSTKGGAAETSGGISSKFHLKINGSTVEAIGGEAKDNRKNIFEDTPTPRTFGLGCDDKGSVTIENSIVIATGGKFSYNTQASNSDVMLQMGKSCGIYCGNPQSGLITFKNCFVVARAGTVDNKYTPSDTIEKKIDNNTTYNLRDNRRCAVYNMNGNANADNSDNSSDKPIVLDGVEVFMAGYGNVDNNIDSTKRLQQLDLKKLQENKEISRIEELAVYKKEEEKYTAASRTTFAFVRDRGNPLKYQPDKNIAATGVVIVPSGWEIKTKAQSCGTNQTVTDASTVIVTTASDAVIIDASKTDDSKGISIDTNGYTFAAVSLYEGEADTAGIRLDGQAAAGATGKVTFTGGGEVIAVGGMTKNGNSYGINIPNAEAAGATINATALTAYGLKSAVEGKALDETSVFKIYPAGVSGQLLKLLASYPLRVNGKTVTSLNRSDVLDDGTVSYNPQGKRLTLNGATVNGIFSDGLKLNLVLDGKNTINADSATGHGIFASGSDLTIQSNGESTVTTGAAGKAGILVGGSLNVKGDGALTVAASGTDSTGVQISSDPDKKITINGGTFTASGSVSALNKALDLTGYVGDYTVTASTSTDGSGAVSYNEADFDTYKYIHIEPSVPLPPSHGGYYIPFSPSSDDERIPSTSAIVYNDPIAANATIWLTGSGFSADDLLITEPLSSGGDYDAMLKLADSADIINIYDVSLKSGKKASDSPMYLYFDLAASYAGQDFTLAHKKADGVYEYFYATADVNGDLKFGPIFSLAPFMLVKGTLAKVLVSGDARDIPQTGDSAAPELGMLMLAIAGLAAGVTLARKKRKA